MMGETQTFGTKKDFNFFGREKAAWEKTTKKTCREKGFCQIDYWGPQN